MISRSSISILYQISPGVLRSKWFSGLEKEAFGGGFQYRIGRGFVGIVVRNLSGYWMDPISIHINSISDCSVQARLLRSRFEEK